MIDSTHQILNVSGLANPSHLPIGSGAQTSSPEHRGDLASPVVALVPLPAPAKSKGVALLI